MQALHLHLQSAPRLSFTVTILVSNEHVTAISNYDQPGLDAGHYMITTEFIGDLLRSAVRGVNPSNNFVLDSLLSLIAQVKMNAGLKMHCL